MSVQTACEALRSGHVLELRYDGYSRFVEVHDVGFTEDDDPIMRAWQVSGGIGNNEPVGRKVLRLDEASEAVVYASAAFAPREGYKPGDPVMKPAGRRIRRMSVYRSRPEVIGKSFIQLRNVCVRR